MYVKTKSSAKNGTRKKWLHEALGSLTNGTTSLYRSCLKGWCDINSKYRVKNQVELDRKLST